MNEKLVKELKLLSANLDKSLEKSRSKQKPANPYADANIKGILSHLASSAGEGAGQRAEADKDVPEGDIRVEGQVGGKDRL